MASINRFLVSQTGSGWGYGYGLLGKHLFMQTHKGEPFAI